MSSIDLFANAVPDGLHLGRKRLSVLDLQQIVCFVDHATDRGRIFNFHGMANAAQTQPRNTGLMGLQPSVRTFDLGNCDSFLSHSAIL